MKELLTNALIRPFLYGDWGDIIVSILAWLVTMYLVGLVIRLLVWLIDSSFRPVQKKDGKVIKKYIVPAHTTTTYVQSGKTLIPVSAYYSTAYYLIIRIDDLDDEFSVREGSYNDIRIGKTVHCTYTTGRIMKTIYIQEVQW
jgi:hypothetical protein